MAENAKNDNLMQQVDSQFRRTYSPTYAWADIVAAYSMLPGLRGFWPMSTVNNAGNCYDHSNLAKTLTYAGNPVYNIAGLAPYIALDGTGDYLTRADEADLDILGTEAYIGIPGLTLGGWFYNTALGGGTIRTLMSKWDAIGVSMSYLLQTNAAGGNFAFSVNAGVASISAGTSPTLNTWHFAVGRFVPSTTVDVYMDDTKWSSAVAVPAALTNSTAPFQIGAANGAALMTGRASTCFLCAAALPDSVIQSLYHISRPLFGK